MSDPYTVTLPMVTVLYSLAPAVLCGVVGFVLAPRSPAAPPGRMSPPTMELGSTEQVSWSQPIGSVWLQVLGVALVLAGIALAVTFAVSAGIGTLVAGVLVLVFSTAMVTVDRRGLIVAFSVLRWPRVRFAVDEIVSAEQADISAAWAIG